MAVLLVLAAAEDAALLRRVYGLGGWSRSPWVPDRIVVDAHVAQHGGNRFNRQVCRGPNARRPADAWAALPFAAATVVTPME